MSEALFAANERNPRTIEPEELAALRESLRVNGDLSGFVLNRRSGRLVGAHQRNTAFADIADKQVVREHVHEPDAQGTVAHGYVIVEGNRYAFREVDWGTEQETAAMIRANVNAGRFDDKLLLQLLDEAKGTPFETLTGFDDKALEELRESVSGETGQRRTAPAGPRHAEAERLQRQWRTARGQLWQLGKHRLLCGDSTNRDDVQLVLGGERAQATITDPPYGIGENYATHEDTPETLKPLIAGFLPLALEVSEVVLITPGNKLQHFYPEPNWRLCWFAPAGQGAGPWGFVCWHVILAYGKCPFTNRGLGSRPDGFQLNGATASDERHPCAKPLAAWEWIILRGSPAEGEVIFDPFLGSGTTILVCESLKRVARGIEIDPKYVAVILERWRESTGQPATLIAGELSPLDEASKQNEANAPTDTTMQNGEAPSQAGAAVVAS